MKNTTYLLCGNHPKSARIKERIVQIVRMLKAAPSHRLPVSAFEQEFGIDKRKDITKFYRPFKLMREWELLISHRSVVFENDKRVCKTEYELTPAFFLRHIAKDLADVCKTELDML